MRYYFFFIILLFNTQSATAGELHKCMDSEGNLVYSQSLEGLPADCREKIIQEQREKKAAEEAEKARQEELKKRKLLERYSDKPKRREQQKPKDEKTEDDANKPLPVAENCDDLPANMYKCQPYACLSPQGERTPPLKKTVNGLTGGMCGYMEDRRKNMMVTCSFTKDERRAVGKYFDQLRKAKTPVTTKTVTREDGSRVKVDIVNGKDVVNLIELALTGGACQLVIGQQ